MGEKLVLGDVRRQLKALDDLTKELELLLNSTFGQFTFRQVGLACRHRDQLAVHQQQTSLVTGVSHRCECVPCGLGIFLLDLRGLQSHVADPFFRLHQ